MTKKSGTSQASVRERHDLFVKAYISHGENATQAALAVKPHLTRESAAVIGHRMLRLVNVQKAIAKYRLELRAKFALTTDRVVQELARVSYFSPKKLVDEDGKLIPLHRLDDDTAAALASIEIQETEVKGRGKEKVVLTRVVKGRPFNKPSALKESIKILHLYERPPPPPEDPTTQQTDERELAKWLAFQLAKEAKAVERAGAQRKDQKAPGKGRKKIGVAA